MHCGDDLGGIDIDDLSVYSYFDLGFAGFDAADEATDTTYVGDARDIAGGQSASGHRLGLKAKLGHSAGDNGIYAQNLTDLTGSGWVRAVRDGEVLLFEDRIEHLTVDYRISAVVDQFSSEQADDTLAYVISADVRRDRAVFEGQNSDPSLLSGLGLGHLTGHHNKKRQDGRCGLTQIHFLLLESHTKQKLFGLVKSLLD